MNPASHLPVVILCGGKGTRLGELGKLRPKPLVPIGGMPVLWHIMKIYSHWGHKRFVLCLGHKGELIEEFIRKGTIAGEKGSRAASTEPDWEVICADTGEETGTSGRVHRIRSHVEGSERFLLTYGDGVSNVPLDQLLAFHLRLGKAATVTGVHPETTFGIIREENGVVTGFAEKPRLNVIINGGFFVLEKRVFGVIDDDGPLEERPLGRLTAERQLAVFRHEGFWQCMDNQKEVEKLNAQWERNDRPWAVWETTK